MMEVEIAIIGGGPAGLCAAYNAALMGAKVLLIERDSFLGGQLVKQTHMFFGSQKQYASTRGIDIASLLSNRIGVMNNVDILLNSTVLGVYEDGVITVESNGTYKKIKPQRIIVSTGAFEKVLAFPNNDLPGIYGAGAVQTLMNVHGVKPGNKVLMVGAGNIGLIVSYQLSQAGVKVEAIIDAAPNIGGYLVHASKVRRMGIPILTSHTVKQAHGKTHLEGATICQLDENWKPIEGSEKTLDVDVMCVSVGLTPLTELLSQAGCKMKFIPELGGHVPLRNQDLQTTIPSIFIAGDVGGVEEASSAMVGGQLAGLCAAKSLGYHRDDYEALRNDCISQLNSLRAGHAGEKINKGLEQATI